MCQVTLVFSWWQQPIIMWGIRSSAERLCWGFATMGGMLGFKQARSNEERTVQVCTSTMAGMMAGYLSHLTFISLL